MCSFFPCSRSGFSPRLSSRDLFGFCFFFSNFDVDNIFFSLLRFVCLFACLLVLFLNMKNIYSNEAIQAFTPYHRILKKPTSLNLFSSDKKASMFPSSAAIPSSSNGTSRAPADGISSPHQTGVSNVGNLRKNVDIVHPILLPLSFALFQEPSLISDSSSRVNVFDDKTQPAPSDLLWSRLSRRDFSSFSGTYDLRSSFGSLFHLIESF